MDAAEPAGPVLLERRTDDGDDVHADRVTEDGQVWRWTTVRAAIDDEGELSFTRGPGDWERLGALDATTLGRLREAIAASGAGELPAEVEPDQAVLGGVQDTWTIAGRRVVVRGVPVATAPPLEALAEALDAAVGSLSPRT